MERLQLADLCLSELLNLGSFRSHNALNELDVGNTLKAAGILEMALEKPGTIGYRSAQRIVSAATEVDKSKEGNDAPIQIRNYYDEPYQFTIPRCMGEGCEEQQLVPAIQNANDPNSFVLGYVCSRCKTFFVSTKKTDLNQWSFCCLMYKNVILWPKDAKDLGEAVELAKKLKGDTK